MKTSELSGVALDWAVAKCEVGAAFIGEIDDPHFYSTDWSQGGPIIERGGISVCYDIELSQDASRSHWATIYAVDSGEGRVYGPTPLIAAMRCYVASELGDEVEIPRGLTE